jgi:integrase/recombinase XerD
VATKHVTMIHLTQVCDIRRTKKDGTHPIIFRISLKGKTRDITTGYSCLKIQWSNDKNCLKSISKEFDILATRLRDQELLLLEKIKAYEVKYPNNNSVQDVKDYLSNKRKAPLTVLEFWEEEIKRLQKAQYYGNARNYKSALDGIVSRTSLRVSFDKVDYKWLIQLETDFRASGLKTNSISIYFRKLRSMYNKAINHGIAEANNYPFRRYKLNSEPTSPRVIYIGELQQFFSHSPTSKKQLIDAWNFGKLIFLLRGINYVDLALLTEDNIKHGRIVYKRSKTHKTYSIEILPHALDIISFYIDKSRVTLLPILTNDEFANKNTMLKVIAQKRKTTNKWLKVWGRELNILEPLTTYVFRYSHANACKKLGFSKDLIGESLGHNYGMSVTSLYLEDYNIELVDEMNKKVCDKIIEGG